MYKEYGLYETFDLIELLPLGVNQKSFYGKAKLLKYKSCNKISLMSYYTVVCQILNGKFLVKYWDDYSVTTLKHINAFLACTGADVKLTKKQWLALKVNEPYFIDCLGK